MEQPEQTKIRVSFDYYPDEPDPEHDVGMSESEYESLMQQLGAIGGDNIEIEKV